jgi:hypothetical protein
VGAIDVGAVTLDLPAIACFNGVVVVFGDAAPKVWRLRFIDARTMVRRELRLTESPGWFVERTGKFREFTPTGKQHAWTRPLRFLWNFILSEFAVSSPRPITVGELSDRMQGIKNHSREAPIASDLRRHLKQFDRNAEVTESMLLAWPI